MDVECLPGKGRVDRTSTRAVRGVKVPSLMLVRHTTLRVIRAVRGGGVSARGDLVIYKDNGGNNSKFTMTQLLARRKGRTSMLFTKERTSFDRRYQYRGRVIRGVKVSMFARFPSRRCAMVVSTMFNIKLYHRVAKRCGSIVS